MTQLYRMTALTPYSNGNVPWPAGQSANWPAGEERIVPVHVWDQIMKDGAGKFSVQFYRAPEPVVTLDPSDGIDQAEASAAGAALAQYAEQSAQASADVPAPKVNSRRKAKNPKE